VRPPVDQRVLLTIGDPNGIGPEVAVKAAASLSAAPPVLVGDRFVIEEYARAEGMTVRETVGLAAPEPGVVDILSVESLAVEDFRPGNVTAAAGKATVDYLRTAVKAVQRRYARAIAAAPHSETAVNAAGIPFCGYPNLLARLNGVHPDQVFLMLAGGGLRITHATLHESLRTALDRLTPDLVASAAAATAASLQALGVDRPRIGVFGLNPHAGEEGLFGDEDQQVTAPAVERLRAAGMDIEGPVGADLLLPRHREFDAFVAMYHDQGHIPVKLLAGRHASALTIGAGLVFASVGHGAAFDIAGKGQADPEATIRAVQMVSQIGAAEEPRQLREISA
jgi:4-hydroxythreonine-4-phosphate dehydrogenase